MNIKKVIQEIKQEAEVILEGKPKDKTYSSEHAYPDEATAREAFGLSRQKLFEVNAWSSLSGLTSRFELHDANGHPKPTGTPEVGDHIRIELPAPNSENWVRVTDLRSEENLANFTVQPSNNPHNKAEPEKTEHFFGKEASSTFQVEIVGNLLIAKELGRNERINNQGPEAGDNPVVNTLVAEGGWAFFQRMQWKKLTEYLVNL